LEEPEWVNSSTEKPERRSFDVQPNELEHLHAQDRKSGPKISCILKQPPAECPARAKRWEVFMRLAATCLLIATGCSSLPFWHSPAANPADSPTFQPELTSSNKETSQPPSSGNASPTNSPGTPPTISTPSLNDTQPVQLTQTPALSQTPPLGTPPSLGSSTEKLTPSSEATSDLIFLADGRLASWNYATARISVLAMNIIDFSVSANGQGIAVQRAKGVAANGVKLYDLAYMELSSRRTTVLVKNTPRLFNITISPDSRRIAYTSQEQGGSIYWITSDTPEQPVKIGTCTREHELVCDNSLVWSPKSSELAWSDQQGIWVDEMGEDQGRLAAPAQIAVTDPKGEKTEVTVTFTHLAWSPTGRYILAEISPLLSEVHWQALVDTHLDRLSEIPGTYEYMEDTIKTTWLPDGSLFVAQPGDEESHRPPHAALWQVVDTRDDLVSLDKEFDFESDNLTKLEDLGAGVENLAPDWLMPLNERLIAFGIRIKDTQFPSLLFSLDLKYSALQEINTVPYDVLSVLWSPDLSGALVIGQHGEIIFAPSDSRQPYELNPLFGSNASAFTWLPPAFHNP
jgi:hypothetical protein